MKAILYSEYGAPEVLYMAEIATPQPEDNEVLVRVHAAPVNFGDLLARRFGQVTPSEFHMPGLLWLMAKVSFGWKKPRNPILGSEFAGVVAGVGKAVTRFRKGDMVFGYLGQAMGAYAEYVCVAESGVLAIKPAHLSDEEAAAIPYGAVMALSLLRQGQLQRGQKILILGASGGIGAAAVQIARSLGAEVTGVCATPRLEYVKALGAQHVIDYTREDFTHNGKVYDLVFDILGKGSFLRIQGSLAPGGRYLLASFKLKQLLQMFWTRLRGGKKVICAMAPGSAEDFQSVRALVEAGKLRAIVDRSFAMEQAAAAHRYVEEGHKRGSVVIQMG